MEAGALLLLSNILAMTGGLMAVSYRDVALAKSWPIGEIFHQVGLTVAVSAATFLVGLASQLLFGSILSAIAILLVSFFAAMFLTLMLRSWAQLTSLALVTGSWGIRFWSLFLALR